ncbi:Transposase [Bifidobacterium longum subsp. longum]|nr:Transposase [Bifidobacterium longum subsp. longum]
MDSGPLRAWVLDALRRGWSPELIEGRLKARYAGDPSMRISHECLCQWIYAKPQRALDLRQYLAHAGLRVKMCVWLGVSRGLDLAFLNAD